MFKQILYLTLVMNSVSLVLAGDEQNSTVTPYWEGDRVVDSGRARIYTAAMHNSFPDIKSKYEENGEFYYSDTVNTFGFREVLNMKQEVVFCGPGDKNFNDAIEIAASSPSTSSASSVDFSSARDDATSFSVSPENMGAAIKQVLVNNASSTAKGRFCYNPNDSRVDYRRSGAEHATYCSSGGELFYSDEVSGYNCSLKLDIPLKEGETRYLRQLQNGQKTVASGFVGCYKNSPGGAPQIKLIDNPDSCTPDDRGTCLRTCDWADDVVCSPNDMPRWGAGEQCGAFGTVLFKGDSVNVSSSSQLSFDSSTGKSYSGEAVMACMMNSGSARWVVVDQTCSESGG